MSTTFSQLVSEMDFVVSDVKSIPDLYYKSIFNEDFYKRSEYDLYTPLEKGKEWLYELTCKYQPKAGEVLMSGSELYILAEDDGNGGWYNSYLTQEVSGGVIQLFRDFNEGNPSDSNYEGPDDDRLISLPFELREAYYNRFLGLSVVGSNNIGMSSNLLPRSISNWVSVDRYLASLKKKNKYLPFIEEVISGVKPDKKSDLYSNFSCFMSNGDRKSMDMFFVKTHIRDGVIYYIKDHDVLNMKVLGNPVEALDRYCEHVLLRKKERFDFSAYIVPLV